MIATRVARLAALLLPLIFVSATCLTDFRQRGDAGPWVGEVTNYGSDTVASVYVIGHIFDATGRDLGQWSATTCPSQLAPGERGTFEIFADTGFGAEPPLEFVPDPGIQGYPVDTQYPTDPYNGFTGEGLTTRVVDKDPVRRFALVEMTNDSPFTYQYITVCANLRTPSGTLAEVGAVTPYPTTLHPGEKQTFPIFFNTMPEGTIEIVPRGSNYCCSNQVTLPGGFTVTATRVVDNGAALRVVGETHNSTGQMINGTAISAHIEGSWADRVDGFTVGCGGVAPSGGTAPASLTLPLSRGALNPTVAIEGTQGYLGATSYAAPVSDITLGNGPLSGYGLPTRSVSATISNPTTAWIQLEGACIGLRDRRGRLVGAADAIENVSYQDRYLAPGATLRINVNVEELEHATTAEAAAYGQPQAAPQPPVAVTDIAYGGGIAGPDDPPY